MPKLKCVLLFMFMIFITILSCSKQTSPYTTGRQFAEIGDYENAIVMYEKALMNQPQNPFLRFDLGKALQNSGSNRGAWKQYQFAARIGSPAVSDSFLNTGQQWVREDPSSSEAYAMFNLALHADNENYDALFEKSRYTIRFSGDMSKRVAALPDFKKALDKRSDDYIVNGAYETLQKNRDVLYYYFASQQTFKDEKHEDYGPAAVSRDNQSIIWVRAETGKKKNKYNLVQKTIGHISVEKRFSVKSWAAYPCFKPDTTQIVYSDYGKMNVYDAEFDSSAFIRNGKYPALSHDGKKIAYMKNHDLYLCHADGSNEKRLIRARGANGLPRFSPEDDRIFYLTVYDHDVWLAVVDTVGDYQRRLLKLPVNPWQFRERPWTYTFDCSPDSDYIVLNMDGKLNAFNARTKEVDPLHVTGRYPRFSANGEFLVAILDVPKANGCLWTMKLDKIKEMNALLDSEKKSRRKLRGFLKEVVKWIDAD